MNGLAQFEGSRAIDFKGIAFGDSACFRKSNIESLILGCTVPADLHTKGGLRLPRCQVADTPTVLCQLRKGGG
jgi:hypothetical protein